MAILDKVNYPQDIKTFNMNQLGDLAQEIREFIINSVTKNGGHFSSNLGVIELVTAIHYVFDTPNDKLIFDVGHQCYAHKILTGRKHLFDKLRQKDGLSGFPKIDESQYDTANAGHASTALSIASGLCLADATNSHQIISIVGDGALTGGLALEAINNLNKINHKQIIIINDNEHAINKCDCVIQKILKICKNYDCAQYFNNINFEYIRVVDGNDITSIIPAL